jgi:hypothetical protein
VAARRPRRDDVARCHAECARCRGSPLRARRPRSLVDGTRRADRNDRRERLVPTARGGPRSRATRRRSCHSPNGTSVGHETTSANRRRTESASTLRPNSHRDRLRARTECSRTHTDADCRRHDGHDPRSHTINLLVLLPRRRAGESNFHQSTYRQCAHPQPEPHPPPVRGAGLDEVATAPPTDANTDRRRTAFAWPSGHVAGSLAADMDRRSSNVTSQVLQRNSYTGMRVSVDLVD